MRKSEVGETLVAFKIVLSVFPRSRNYLERRGGQKTRTKTGGFPLFQGRGGGRGRRFKSDSARDAQKSRPENTHLDAKFGVLRRAIRRVLTLAREGRVVVLLPRHHPQHGLHREERPVFVRLLRGFDATMKHVAQSIDPRDLQETLQLKIALRPRKNARARGIDP